MTVKSILALLLALMLAGAACATAEDMAVTEWSEAEEALRSAITSVEVDPVDEPSQDGLSWIRMLLIVINGVYDRVATTRVSWTDTVVDIRDGRFNGNDGFDNRAFRALLLDGGTVAEPYSASDTGKEPFSCVMLYLPNDASIGGEQTVTLELERRGKVKVRLNLDWPGGYDSTESWDATLIDYDYAPRDGFDRMGTPETVELECMTFPMLSLDDLGQNDDGEDVYAILYANLEGVYGVITPESVSWADSLIVATGAAGYDSFEESREGEADNWERARDGQTACAVSAFYSWNEPYTTIHLYLPDDASIAGEQSATFALENGDRLTIRFKLTWKGDYAAGLGWDAELIDCEVTEPR